MEMRQGDAERRRRRLRLLAELAEARATRRRVSSRPALCSGLALSSGPGERDSAGRLIAVCRQRGTKA
jgi:hypothetical protein